MLNFLWKLTYLLGLFQCLVGCESNVSNHSPSMLAGTLYRTPLRMVRTLKGHTARVNSVAFSTDGRLLASGTGVGIISGGDFGNTIKIWEVSTGRLLRTLDYQTYVYSVAFSPDGRLLAFGGWENYMRLWKLDTYKVPPTKLDHGSFVTKVAFTPDNRIVASSGSNMIKLWEVSTGKLLRTLQGDASLIYSMAISAYGGLIAAGSKHGNIIVWEINTGKVRYTFRAHLNAVTSVVFGPNGYLLASGSHDTTVALWNIRTGQLLRRLTESDNTISSVAISPDGRILAAGSSAFGGNRGNMIFLWEVNTGKLLPTKQGPWWPIFSSWFEGRARTLAFSPNRYTLASGNSDKTIKLWQ